MKSFGPKVRFFSNTKRDISFKQRLSNWKGRGKRELFHAFLRKARKAVSKKSLPFAQAIHIEVTNHCNLKCPMCPHPTQKRALGKMDKALFVDIIKQLAPYRNIFEGVALMGLGEPLLHKELEDFSKIGKEAGLPNVYTSTNAVLLDKRRAEKIIKDSGFDKLIFSVDGFSQETFSKLRKGADYKKVYANIETFLSLKKVLKRGPQCVIQILVMDQTRNELEGFCDYWTPKLGPSDQILIKEVDTFGGLVKDRRLDLSKEPKNRFPCRQLWKDLSISWDGRVTVCCKDVFYTLEVGNANKTPLLELWKSKKWNRIRGAHLKGIFNMDPCEDCREWYI